jgi:signal transduction histidine kinase
LSVSLVPISIGIAILKYRLYDIDVVINKTIVFGVLAAFITGIYVAIVVGIGALLGSRDEPNLALSIAATAIVAIAFSPVKERTQRIANRLVYGHRLSPYEVLADLSRTAATVPTPGDVIQAVAHAATLGVNAQGATVTLDVKDEEQVIKTHPEDFVPGDGVVSEAQDVIHEGDRLGKISIYKRAGSLTPQDGKLLDDLSKQAGLVFHNARLALELQARLDEISSQADELELSRSRIVSAADESRRRLEEDITQGPRSNLVSIQRELKDIKELLNDTPDVAATRLEGVTAKANETLDALRELARGIYPPLLADQGIVAALEAHIRKNDLPVSLDPGGAEAVRFDESIETTVYFCCVEGLAGATEPGRTVGLSIWQVGDQLHFSIESAASEEARAAIRDRVEAVGGAIAVGSHGDIEASLPSGIMEPAS